MPVFQCVLSILPPTSSWTPPRTPRTLPTLFALLLFLTHRVQWVLSPCKCVWGQLLEHGQLPRTHFPKENSSSARDRTLWFWVHPFLMTEPLLTWSCTGIHSHCECVRAIVMSRKRCSPAVLHNVRLLQAPDLLSHSGLWASEWEISVLLRAECTIVIYSLTLAYCE